MAGRSVFARVITDGSKRKTLSPPRADESAQSAIQGALDQLALAGGGTLRLKEGVYPVNNIKMPWTSDVRYSNIVILGLGLGATIVPDSNTNKNLWDVGVGYTGYFAAKIKNTIVQNVTFDVRVKQYPARWAAMTMISDQGSRLYRVTVKNSRAEAFITGGFGSSIGGEMRDCMADGCGLPATSPTGQPLAGFNINSYQWKLFNCSAFNCGHGIECGGTECEITDCHFHGAQCLIGSAVAGCSGLVFRRCQWNGCNITVSNGIGVMGRMLFDDCDVTAGNFNFQGSRDVNSVPPDQCNMPNHTLGPVRWSNCRFNNLGGSQAVRMTNWYTLYDHGPNIEFTGTKFDCQNGLTYIQQGLLANSTVNFTGNDFRGRTAIGTMYGHLPDGTPLPYHGYNLSFSNNNAGAGAVIATSGGNPNNGWPASVSVQ